LFTILVFVEGLLRPGYSQVAQAISELGQVGTPNAILQPLDAAILTMTMVTVSGTASDNIAVAKVEVSMDGVTWTLATGTTSWSVNLTLPEGRSRIRAAATDTSGNSWVASINVTVQPGARTPPIESSTAALLVGVPTAVGLAGGAVVWLRRGSRLRGRDQR
jgi:hypothetical protein